MLEDDAKVPLLSDSLEWRVVEEDCWKVCWWAVVMVECHCYCLVDVYQEMPVVKPFGC